MMGRWVLFTGFAAFAIFRSVSLRLSVLGFNLGMPSFTPRALAAASAALVR